MNIPNGDDPSLLSSQDIPQQTRLTPLQTEAVYRVAQSLIVSLGLPNLLQSIVNSTAEVLPANRVTLITFEIAAHQVIHFAKGGPGIDHVVKVSFDELWDGLSGWALRELKPALSHDRHNDPRESPEARQRNIETHCGAIIVVPLQFQNRVLGTLTAINGPDEARFTDADVALMMAIANLSAVAIENSQLYGALQATNADLERRLKERTAELAEVHTRLQQEVVEQSRAEQTLHEREQHSQSLLRLSTSLENTQTYADVLNAAQHEVKQVMGYQNLWVYLLTDDKKCFKALVADGRMADTVMSEEGAATLPIQGDLMLEEIAEAKTIVVVEDARTDARTDKEIVARLGSRTIVNVPIILFDQHLGSFGTGTFGDEGVHVPTQPEQEYLAAMASHMGAALHRMHLLIERKRADEERAAHLRFFEGLDRVNRTMQAITDLDQMMRDILDVLLSVFDCDRAWLVYPCDPAAATWQVPMERTRPEYPGVIPVGVELPLDQVGASVYRILRDASGPVQFNTQSEHQVPIEMAEGFNVQSFIAMAFYPKIGKPWAFGLHQCSYPRVWTPEEERLFQAISYRLTDALSSLLTYRDLQRSEQELRQSNNLLQSVIEAAPTAIIGVDLDGNVQLVWNSAAEKMLGWTAAEAMGQLLPSVQRENQVQFKSFRDRIRRGESMNGVEVNRQKRDGSPIDYSIYASPLYDAHGSLMGNIAVLVDITERKRIQSIMQARLRLLEFAGTHSMDELLTATLDEIEKLTNSAIGFYHFLQPDQKTLSLQNWSTNTLKTLCTAEGKGSHYPVDQAGVWVDCVHERRPVIHNDYAALPHRKGLPEGHAPVIRQAVVPIFRGNLIEAIIGLGNKPTPYNDNDIEIISQLGDMSWDIAERKRAEEALQKQYSTLHGIMENANALIFSIDRDYQYTSFNQAHAHAMKMLYGAAIEIGQNLLQYMNVPEDREVAKHNLDRALAGERHIEESYSGEELRSRRYFQVSHSPIQAETGVIVGVVVLAQDITEGKQAEAALRESEQRYRQVFDNTSDCLYLLEVTDEGRFRNLEINPALEISTGLTRDQLIGKTQEETVPEEVAQVVNTKYRHCVQAGVPIEEEVDLDLPAGRHSYQSMLIPVRNEAGNIYRIIGVSRDVTESKRAAEALRQSELQFRLLAENSTDMITRHSPDGVYLYVSPACTTLLGYEPSDLIGHSAYEFFHPDDVPVVATSHTTILTQPMIFTVQYRIRRKDGQYIWFETTSKTIADEKTNIVTEIQAASRDITERKHMEQTLAIREQESRTLLENIPDLIVRYDTNLHRIYVNPAWEKSSGLMIQEVVNRPLGELNVPEPLVAEYLAKLQEVLETGTRQTAEFTWTNARGEALTLNYTIVPEYEPNGQMVSILCVGHDITERKQAEVTLQHYLQRLAILHKIDRHILKARSPHDIANSVLEQLIHLIPCEWAGIVLHDKTTTEARMYALQQLPDTHFHAEKKYAVLSNQVMEQLQLGHSITIADLQTPTQGPHTELSKQLIAENLRAKLMTPLMLQDQLIGVLILASYQVNYFTKEHQQVAEEIGAQLAITFYQANLNDQIAQHTIELERRVRERTTELEHVNQELEAFSYSVSHDLRAPLRAIEGFAEIIARRHREDLNDEGRHYFDNIVQASEQMNQLITDLLAYARLGRQRQGQLKLLALSPILAEVQANLAPLIAETGGQIQVANDLPAVRGDKTLLKQIFTNLLENALVYHRPGVPPVVRVTFILETDAALIRVEDNGIGIPPEFREKIFGIFQRLHSQEQYPGTGIGLAIVRKTVEMLGGDLWVESADAEGSRFCVKLCTKPEKDR
ncbi:MAG: PAS domain S-box protein [Chloroflexi bacterium]|nr:PAS domain S-box protein [Chloroflexota bacterium]